MISISDIHMMRDSLVPLFSGVHEKQEQWQQKLEANDRAVVYQQHRVQVAKLRFWCFREKKTTTTTEMCSTKGDVLTSSQHPT